ncbi:D-alanyl-D-alanine carboxypeptidase [Aquibacillus koreensis]|uniref:D-alanyl-D-alanine carboxypeptidase n=1 Tax=Aquibacillus koreensis TaxID=279446 RepID=A0A9X4AHT2_9BACI|nr:D-alanyl-D-alanine carboxypeptidase family protein [Aquibacillus koreensis]MCT2535971.1 D-alanyl-D-alanine carboxypeptidase [Aquibacillus koreensis]MDC3420427.1 D-alanyl-D-alanine carboxypeptidase [Aquibacillus koreensis]
MRKISMILGIFFIFNCITMQTVDAEAELEYYPDQITSEAAILMDANSGQVLYEKSASVPLYPASLTKIATAIYTIEKGQLDDIVTVSQRARDADGTRVYLEPGEKVTLEKLIQGLLINSGNDAGVAIAEHLDGSVERFAENINDFLENTIGVKDTHFENPHGLYDPNHITTAKDLADISRYAMINDVFRKIIATKELEWDGESWVTTIFHHHRLMREIPYDGITGGKTGFVDESGHTLMTTAERDEISLIVITLNSPIQLEAYNDTVALLDYGFENFETTSIEEGTTFKNTEGETFITADTLFYTQIVGDVPILEVTEDGHLSIDQSDDMLNISLPLKKEQVEEMPVLEKQTSEEQVITDSKTKTVSPLYWIVPLMILLGIAIFIFRRKQLYK